MELVRFPSSGGFSVRSIITFVLAVVLTALLWATVAGLPVQAQEANWSGDMIVFENHGFSLDTTFTDPTSTIPANSTVYKTPVQDVDTGNGIVKRVFVLYFSPGLDPPTETTANYVEFDINNNQFTNPANRRTVDLTLKGTEAPISSCAVSGVGWIICPATTYLAEGMDAIFDIVSGMISTQPPILGDTDSSLYKAWDVMRSIANVAFVIAFLIIIYSQITGMGVSNYGLKKLIPRLVVAAILVNVSFIISALAIDISNILGYSVQDVFVGIRESLVTITDDDIGGAAIETTWATVTSIALGSGGAIAGTVYLSTGGSFLIVPMLLGAFLTILLVVIILVARQAIIVILVIIAPLAFVANLLPNTEKLFNKWKDLFMTMLVFFPAFSLVFGGSQLAGQIIIQNAGTNLVMVIFGLAVQIAPLIITPLILKLSGGLLGKIAQIANDPKKGLLDRNRNWAERRAAHAKQKALSNDKSLTNPFNWSSRVAQGSENRRRNLEDSTERYKKRASNRYNQTKGYRKIYDDMADATEDESRIGSDNSRRVEDQKRNPEARIHGTAMRAAISKEKLETSQNALKTYYNSQRNIGGTALNISGTNLEESKMHLESSESDRSSYLNEYRSNRATVLGRAAEQLEASKLNAEGWQNTYTQHVEDLKLNPNSGVHAAAKYAQSTKDHYEAAQNQVQAMFDRDRNTAGTELHAANISLEGSKLDAENAKSRLVEYINRQRSTVKDADGNYVDGILHVRAMQAERSKSAAQLSELNLKGVVEEYKTGKLDRDGVYRDIMDDLVSDNEMIAAETRRAQAAQNIQQKNVFEAFVEGTPRSEELLDTAASVDPHGRLRAVANATAQLSRIEKEALDNNTILLKSEAEEKNISDLEWARTITNKHRGTHKENGVVQPAEPQDDGLLEAAFDRLASDGDIGAIRDAMIDTNFDDPQGKYKTMMGRVIARNAGTLMAKGGFDLQQKIGKLWNVSQEEMDWSTAFSLGSVTAENIPNQKWGWWNSYIDPAKIDANGRLQLERMIHNVDSMAPGQKTVTGESKEDLERQLRSAYANITTALSSPEIMSKLGDRNVGTGKMHAILHARFNDGRLQVDYDKTNAGVADTRRR